MTAHLAAFRTDRVMNIDLSVPIWTIDHVAAALHLEVDTAREYTYRDGFPAAKAGFARNLWLRDDVLSWFAALPASRRATRRPSTSTVAVRNAATHRPSVPRNSAPTTAPAAPVPARRTKSYTPRAR